MKFLLTKTCRGVIDTQDERDRIDRCFQEKGDSAAKKRLLALMDKIEAQDWQGAAELLKDKWWRKRDSKDGICNCECIGNVYPVSKNKPEIYAMGFDAYTTYYELVFRMLNSNPEEMEHKMEKIG